MASRKPGPYAPLAANYADDEKIMEAGEDAELLYIRMLAYAARTPRTEGWVSDAVIQSRLGILPRPSGNGTGNETGTDAGSRAARLHEVGLIERSGTGYRIASWLKWNKSVEEMDRDKANDRKRKGDDDQASSGTGTGNSTGTATVQRADSSDQKQKQKQKQKSARATRLPDGFEITDDMRQWATGTVPGLNLDWHTSAFKDYWSSATKNAVKSDWAQAWRNWMRKEFERGNLGPKKQSSVPDLGIHQYLVNYG